MLATALRTQELFHLGNVQLKPVRMETFVSCFHLPSAGGDLITSLGQGLAFLLSLLHLWDRFRRIHKFTFPPFSALSVWISTKDTLLISGPSLPADSQCRALLGVFPG